MLLLPFRFQIPREHKQKSLQLESCVREPKDRLQYSKSSVVSVLGVLTVIPVPNNLIWWNWTGWWLPYKKWQAACSFRETEIMDQSCCHNAKTSDPMCFFLVGGRLQLSSFHRSNILIFPYYLNFHLQDNTLPCTFRAVQATPGVRTGSVPFAELK